MAPIHLNKIQRIFKIWDVWVARRHVDYMLPAKVGKSLCEGRSISTRVTRGVTQSGYFFFPTQNI